MLGLSSFAFADVCNSTYKEISTLVTSLGWKITSTNTGRHNKNSRHYRGKAVDVSVKFKSEFEVLVFIETLEKEGYTVVDERIRPFGQRVWTGPHFHIYAPDCATVEVKYEVNET